MLSLDPAARWLARCLARLLMRLDPERGLAIAIVYHRLQAQRWQEIAQMDEPEDIFSRAAMESQRRYHQRIADWLERRITGGTHG